jgi:hypothetical protein
MTRQSKATFKEKYTYLNILSVHFFTIEILLIVISVKSGINLVIRTCSVDSGSLTVDTELNRIEHMCGLLFFTNSVSYQER